MLGRACRLARKWSGSTLPNPIADSEMPSYGIGDRTEVRAPTILEVKALIEHLEEFDPRFSVFVRVILATGMRRGEACALRWSDVDLDQLTVLIDESVIGGKGQVTVKSPKTRASIRRVAIDNKTTEELANLRSIQEDLASYGEVELEESGFVFSFVPGGDTPPYPDTFSHNFAKLRESAAVAADIHLHSLRHFQATLLDPILSEKQKQARLGWSNPVMARHYTDIIADEDRRAATYVASVLDSDLKRTVAPSYRREPRR